MEAMRTAEADTLDSDSGITAEIMDNGVDSFPPNSSSLEEIEDSKCNRLKTLESDSIIVGQTLDSVVFIPLLKEEDGINLYNKEVMSSLLKNCDGSELGNGGELCPATSSPNSEAIEISSTSDETEDLQILSDCETPNGNMFNPFAHGPEELALAPKKKILRKIEIATCRQLKFDDCCESEGKVDSAILNQEGYILDSICESFPKLIVSTQVEDIVEDNISNGFKTPSSVPLLTGTADTCPDTPMRPASKLRRLDQGSFRKLEFGSYLS